ncbi:MAG: membrane associated rhomboid family serine protease [Candidatus Azotimanducaceae bacterium]|jgi:membrane associated rhomboid family serine protease
MEYIQLEFSYEEDFFQTVAIKRVISVFLILLVTIPAFIGLVRNIDVPLGYQIAIVVIVIGLSALYLYSALNCYSLETDIVVKGDSLSLPNYYNPKHQNIIPFESIYSKKLIKRKEYKKIKLHHINGVDVVINHQLEEPDRLEDLFERIETNDDLVTRQPQPWATYAIAVVIAASSLLHIFYDSATPLIDLIRHGAWEQSLILSGEADRLLSYTFLHQHLLHLASSLVALIIIGLMLEHRVKWHQLLVIFFVGAVVGSFGGFFSSHLTIIGASGGIYALVGTYLFYRFRKPDPACERFTVRTLIAILFALVFDTITTYYYTDVAFGLHIFGLGFGVFCGYLLIGDKFQRAIPIMLVPLLILTLLSAIRFWQQSDEQSIQDAEQWLTGSEGQDRAETGAWIIATTPSASKQKIDLAITQLRKSRLGVRGKDVLATLYARSGRLPEAIALSNTLIERDESIISQLARFELAYTQDNPINIEEFDKALFIEVDAICNGRVFARVITYQTDQIPEICRRQQTIYVKVSRTGAKTLRYTLDPEVMALPL